MCVGGGHTIDSKTGFSSRTLKNKANAEPPSLQTAQQVESHMNIIQFVKKTGIAVMWYSIVM